MKNASTTKKNKAYSTATSIGHYKDWKRRQEARAYKSSHCTRILDEYASYSVNVLKNPQYDRKEKTKGIYLCHKKEE